MEEQRTVLNATERRLIFLICEIKRYENDPKPFALWVNNEYIDSFATIVEAALKYEEMLKEKKGA